MAPKYLTVFALARDTLDFWDIQPYNFLPTSEKDHGSLFVLLAVS